MQPLQPARLAFRNGVPCSLAFDDVYFSREGGIDEVRHVFLAGNDLPSRWTGTTVFTIGETGFGTGLNFLLTVAEWRRHAPANARLHFVSVEKHPFHRTDLQEALALWPQLAREREALLEVWPPLVEGLHRRELFAGRVTLHLLFGDAAEQLDRLEAKVDAWYLDGFAPSRNPQMWQSRLFEQVARLSRPGATFATFTAAGDVRRGLAAAGFRVHKRPGYGRKREMLAGCIETPPAPRPDAPWFLPSAAPAVERRAIVVGAGLAGATTAFELADRGWQVQVVERQRRIAAEASGNPAGVLMPRLTADMNADARFHLQAYLHTLAWLAALERRGLDTGFHATGVLQLDPDRRAIERRHPALPPAIVVPLSRSQAGERAGIPVTADALHFPEAGWLSPPALCERLLGQAGIDTRIGTHLRDLAWQDGQWSLRLDGGETLSAPVLVLANGVSAMANGEGLRWDLQRIRGQISYLHCPPEEQPALPVCGEGYLTPTGGDFLVIGATYDPASDEPGLRDSDHRANRETLRRTLPSLAARPITGGRVGFRTTCPDHLPVIGPIPDPTFFHEAYADLHHGRPAHRYPVARYLPGLYVTTAHGSRGLATCPLAASEIAAHLNGEPLPLLHDAGSVVHPARFLVRHLKRRR